MRTKILTLGLICLCLFSCEGIKNPHSTDPLGLPTVNHFMVTHLQGDCFTLSWSTQDAETVEIDQGIGEVPVTGTMEVQIFEPTTYTLTANNERGTRTASCEGVPTSLMEVEITTIPETVIFTYYPNSDTSKSAFTLIITETNGEIGGGFNGEIRSFIYQQTGCWSLHLLEWRTIKAHGTVMYDVDVIVKCRDTVVQAYIDGTDEAGREIQKLVDLSITWTN